MVALRLALFHATVTLRRRNVPWRRYAFDMTTNRQELEDLLTTGRIRMQAGDLLNRDPAPLPTDFDFARVSGMMLGLAIGDALGNTTESMLPAERASRGEIRDYLEHPRFGDCRGYPSDDTQLAFWTLEQLIADGAFVPQNVIDAFLDREIFGIGGTVKRALAQRRGGKDWRECGLRSAGNGALMRIAPILIPHLRRPSLDLWADAALCGMLTHNDSASIASCVAFVHVLWELLRMDAPPEPQWWPRTFGCVLRELETGDLYESRSPVLSSFRGTLSEFLDEELIAAFNREMTVRDACDRWYSGAFIPETVPSVLYILMKHAADPEEAIVRAVNDTWDNDTVAAIVGAAVGALHGTVRLPARWRDGLSGRTGLRDDGRIPALLVGAERVFAPA
jgi:ADP-ribosylglycohydrolase